MKTKPNLGLPQYSGKYGEVIFCYNRILGTSYVRRNTYPRLTEHNSKIGAVTRNLNSLQPSQGYKLDLELYLMRYNALSDNRSIRSVVWTNIYLKLMYAMAKAMPEIDLTTLTREYIYEHNLPCISIKNAVKAGLLPKVVDWEAFDHQL